MTPLLPPQAFARNPRRVAYAAVHALVLLAACDLVRRVESLPLRALASAVAGHSLMSLALFAHELSHNAVVRPGWLRTLLELLSWGPNLIPPTVWRVVHNQTHHRHANTLRDPDRRFVAAEATAGTRVYTALFYPHGGTPRRNPLVLLHFLPYVLKQTLGALFPAGRVALMIPAPCLFSRLQRLRIAGELLLIAGIQCGLFVLAGGGIAYVFVGPLAVAWASVFIMLYVFTNHFANAVLDSADPLAGTTSVIVSPVLDWLHLNFSFHTEHHLFPAMDGRFLPLVSRLLQEHFPGRYHRVPIAGAWRLAWQRGAFAEVEATDSAGSPSRKR